MYITELQIPAYKIRFCLEDENGGSEFVVEFKFEIRRFNVGYAVFCFVKQRFSETLRGSWWTEKAAV